MCEHEKIPISEAKGGKYRTVCRVDEGYEAPKTNPQLLFKLPTNGNLFSDLGKNPEKKTNTQLRLIESANTHSAFESIAVSFGLQPKNIVDPEYLVTII